MSVRLLLDPDSGRRPEGLIAVMPVEDVRFGYHDADPLTGPRCNRCNRLLHHHIWQVADDDRVVIDCEANR